MEDRILRKTALFLLFFSVVCCLFVPHFSQLHETSEKFLADMKEYRTKTKAQRMNLDGLDLVAYNNRQASKESGEETFFSGRLRMALPFGVSAGDIRLEEDQLAKKVTVEIPFAGEDYPYDYPILGDVSHLQAITYEWEQGYGTLTIRTDQVCELQTEHDEDFFYFKFLTLPEVYDKVVVIDAGYGGDAFGTVVRGIYEKDINLDIAVKLKEVFEEKGDGSLGVFYTRLTDDDPAAGERMSLAQEVGADLYVGISCNATQSGRMSSIHGTQVVYDGSDEKSKALAQVCLEEVTAMTGSSNKGLVMAEEGEKLCEGETPAIILKSGFMTNEEEFSNLRSEEYQDKIAQGIYNAIVRAFAEMF